VTTVSGPRQAVDLMKPSAGFNPAAKAIVETAETITASTDTTARASVTSYDAKTIEIETSSPDEGFLVLSEIYYPAGWEATIDGEPATIFKTNFVLRGLQVPAGEHTIRMTFEPASNIWGLRLAWAGHILLWVTGIGAVGLWNSKRDTAP
ncbi:YfhO family protein, partial [Fodinibius sp.]|uniref:YfhO family protein n=1 Tax=Fodinibius sp. TaxID=1872440 RepID=UPI0035699E4F